MDKTLYHAARIAAAVRKQIEQSRVLDLGHMTEQRDALAQRMRQLAELAEQLHRAWFIGYRGASRRLQQRFDRRLDELLREIQHLKATRELQGDSDRPLPTPRQVLEELRQIEDEFGDWTLENANRTLSVITDPVVLEGVALGRFRIALDLHRLAEDALHLPFRVVALDPNPAAESDQVTHPHVSNEQLCAGDATTAIGIALRDGRLADFFLLARNVLNNYNPESPYVSLEDWQAESCPDCGDGMYEGNRCWCELCDRDYCDRCVGVCQHCDQTTCYVCLLTCDHCEETYCRQCMSKCAGCGQSCCPGCLEDELCPACYEQKESDDDQEEEQTQENIQPEERGVPQPQPAETAAA